MSIDDNDLIIEPGSLVLACGMTGSGKSSFLRLLYSDATVGYLPQEPPVEPFDCSYGERRLKQIDAVLAQNPEVLLLDEPCAGLDPLASRQLIERIISLNKQEGATVVIAERNLGELLNACDRVLFLVKGRIIADEDAQGFVLGVGSHASPFLSSLPMSVQMAMVRSATYSARLGHDAAAGLYLAAPFPLTVGQAREWFARVQKKDLEAAESPITAEGVISEPLLTSDAFGLEPHPGEILALVGANGSGKSRFLSQLSGNQECSYLPQDLPASEEALSTGERQEACVLAALAQEAKLYLLDEPTKGLDARRRDALVKAIKERAKSGSAVVVASQDLQFVADCADFCVLVCEHTAAPQKPAREFLWEQEVFTTETSLITRGMADNCLTLADVASLFQ